MLPKPCAVVAAASLCLLVSTAGPVRAQQSLTLEELSALRANPFSGMRTVTLQYQNNFNYPSPGHSQPSPSLQVIWPFAVSENWSVITDTVVPAYSQVDDAGHRVAGLGDTQIVAALTPDESGTLIWGFGPMLQAPTATRSSLGTDLWSAGPALGLYVTPGNWTIGALFENFWSFAGAGKDPVNQFSMLYNVNYNLPDGWFVESNTPITADWRTSAGNAWTVPLGGGFGKVFTLGTRSLSLSTQAFYNAPHPEGGPDWSLAFSAQLLFPD